MAGKNVPQSKVSAILVPLATIFHDQALNGGRMSGDMGTKDEVADTLGVLTDVGWRQDEIGTFKVVKATPEQIAQWTPLRQAEWDGYKAAAQADPNRAIDLQVWESWNLDEKGKLFPIEYAGVSAFRRRSLVAAANLARAKKGLPVSKEVSVRVCVFDSPLAMLLAQVADNDQASAGKREMSNKDRILAAVKVYNAGGIESNLLESFKRGVCQKLWQIARLNSLAPSVRIVERMCADPLSDDFLPWSVDQGDMRLLADRYVPEKLAEINAKLKTSGKDPIKPASIQEIEEYFKSPKANGSNKKAVMNRKEVEGILENCSVKIVRRVAKAFLDNNKDVYSRDVTNSTAWNALDALQEDGDIPPVELLLVRIAMAKGPNRVELLKMLHGVAEQHKPVQ